MSGSFIRIENISHTFQNGYKGLDTISLTINKGEFIVIAGKNGSGKTLLMKHLSGLETPDSGDIFYNDISIVKKPECIRGKIGLIFQDADSQILGETVYDDIAIGPKNLRLKKDEIISITENVLEWSCLTDKKDNHPYSLSGGEKRRLAIAGMLAMNCEVMVFDEPFANLDYPSIVHVLQSLVKLQSDGKTVIVLTHELEKVLSHADRLVILDNGLIKYDVTTNDIHTIDFNKFGLRNPFVTYTKKEDLTWLQ